jgi:hypothetical protein
MSGVRFGSTIFGARAPAAFVLVALGKPQGDADTASEVYQRVRCLLGRR